MQSYETGEKAAEVDLLRERVHLLEEEVRTQEKKALDAAAQVDKLQKESEDFFPFFLLFCCIVYLIISKSYIYILLQSVKETNCQFAKPII